MNAEPQQREYRIVAAGEFKATCLQLMDEVNANKNLTIIITKRSKPVAQMSAPPQGLRLHGPSVEVASDTHAVGPLSASHDKAAAAVEEHRHKKHKRKKKHR